METPTQTQDPPEAGNELPPTQPPPDPAPPQEPEKPGARVLLVAYGVPHAALPPIVGRTGLRYGRALFNSSLRRHEVWIDLDAYRDAHRDIFNQLRRPGGQWIVADVEGVDYSARERATAEENDRLKTENDALQRQIAKLQGDYDALLARVLEQDPTGRPVNPPNIEDASHAEPAHPPETQLPVHTPPNELPADNQPEPVNTPPPDASKESIEAAEEQETETEPVEGGGEFDPLAGKTPDQIREMSFREIRKLAKRKAEREGTKLPETPTTEELLEFLGIAPKE